jgi:hypothetical protein
VGTEIGGSVVVWGHGPGDHAAETCEAWCGRVQRYAGGVRV